MYKIQKLSSENQGWEDLSESNGIYKNSQEAEILITKEFTTSSLPLIFTDYIEGDGDGVNIGIMEVHTTQDYVFIFKVTYIER